MASSQSKSPKMVARFVLAVASSVAFIPSAAAPQAFADRCEPVVLDLYDAKASHRKELEHLNGKFESLEIETGICIDQKKTLDVQIANLRTNLQKIVEENNRLRKEIERLSEAEAATTWLPPPPDVVDARQSMSVEQSYGTTVEMRPLTQGSGRAALNGELAPGNRSDRALEVMQRALRRWGDYNGPVDNQGSQQFWDAVGRVRRAWHADRGGAPATIQEQLGGGLWQRNEPIFLQWHNPDDRRLVEKIQMRLKELGFDPGPADGKFGAMTLAAIETFQYHHGLVVDGLYSEALLGILDEEVGKSQVRRAEAAGRSATR